MHLPSQTSYLLEANEMIDRYIHFYNYERIQQNRSGAANAAPLLLKLNIPTPGAFLCCLHNLGRFNVPVRGVFCVFSISFCGSSRNAPNQVRRSNRHPPPVRL